MNRFKPLKSRFRATFSGTETGVRLGEVDKENEVLHGVQITLEGEAKGHGIHLDREFCEAVAAAGNATGDVGLKVRYGHPAMCSDALGTELGRAKNFEVRDIERVTEDGEKVTVAGVFADVEILKSAHAAPQGDIAKHVLEMAAEDPGQFGQSIVFTYADWVVKDADGNRHSYKAEVSDPEDKNKALTGEQWFAQSADGKIYAVLGKLHGTDFTDTPAATDGVFSTGTLAEEAERMLEEHPQIFDAIENSPKSLLEFLERTGLDKKLESARVAGLQAAKDKEIAALKSEIEIQKTVNEQLLADFNAQVKALEAAQERNKQLHTKCIETETALAKVQAALAAEQERYRAQVGAALQQPTSALTNLHGRDLAVAALKARGE
ncbi:MAG: hypothetical protein J6S05_01025 [Bacteroidaceae bacterium]|nr:hypothetical protein [Bacteroidaceae bacterium]